MQLNDELVACLPLQPTTLKSSMMIWILLWRIIIRLMRMTMAVAVEVEVAVMELVAMAVVVLVRVMLVGLKGEVSTTRNKKS